MTGATIALCGSCLQCKPAPLVHLTGSTTPRRARVQSIGGVVRASEQSYSHEGHAEPPKLEPFSQTRLSRSMPERSFLEKAETAISDRCMTLDGEAAYECWEALDEYEHILEEAETECNVADMDDHDAACGALERFESMVRQSGGVNSLISNVRMVAVMKKLKKDSAAPGEEEWLKAVSQAGEEVEEPSEHENLHFVEDGGIPSSAKDLHDEIENFLGDSAFTRFLRRRFRKADVP